MKHVLTKANGSSVYKTKGAAKQAANRFLKANQGDYRMDIQQVEGGFEVTMVELVEATNQDQDEIQALKDKITMIEFTKASKEDQLKNEIAKLKEEVKRGNEALEAVKKISNIYHNRGINWFEPAITHETDKDAPLDKDLYEYIYIANEIAYGHALEIAEGYNPLKALNDLVDNGYATVQKDNKGVLSLKGSQPGTPISELDHDDLIAEKMRLYAELQPEKIVNIILPKNHANTQELDQPALVGYTDDEDFF